MTRSMDLLHGKRPPKDPRTAPVKPVPFRLPVEHIFEKWPVEEVAQIMKVTPRTVQRWRHSGVDGWTGDRLAVKVCGTTGYNLWGDEFNQAFAHLEPVDD